MITKVKLEEWHHSPVELVWTDSGKYAVRFTLIDGRRVTQHFEAPLNLVDLLKQMVPAP